MGEKISAFMTSLAEHDRVFVILSDKYLHSENCRFELKEVWRYCQQNEAAFRVRVFVYRLADARIYDLDYQLEITGHWSDLFDKTKPMIEKLADKGVLAGAQLARYKNLSSFATLAGDVLAFIADTLRPADFDDFVKHGFGDAG